MNRRTFLFSCPVFGMTLPTLSHAKAKTVIYPPIPVGYVETGNRLSVPPLILYGVALQESSKLFGRHALPYPWTLNVQGIPKRYPTYAAAVAGLRAHIAAGITSIDCGLMQVNWRYHADKLGSLERALDPYPNLHAGARILRTLYQESGNWFVAVGRYHAPANPERARNYAQQVTQRMERVAHA